jgi:phosphoglucomutase
MTHATLERAVAGMATLAVPEAVRGAAADNLHRWITDPRFAAYMPQLESMVERGAWDALLDAFYQVIPFGTGGRRGPVGVGPNRINPWTLATSVQGHVHYLRKRFPDADGLAVVLAYDVRAFRDLRGIYDPARPNPVLGLTSRDLAELAARVYAANGVRVHVQRRGDPRFLSTPELSFAIRQLGAHAGLNLSASHNHPDDNGGKFYNHLGGQEIPPHDEAMVDEVAAVVDVALLSWEEAVASGELVWLDDGLHRAYVEHVASCSLTPSRSARVVFTGLHGTGTGTVVEVLRAVGFEVILLDEQCDSDGAFPTVPFRAPNPEVPQAFDRAVAFARTVGADMVLATDPDADRIGCVVRVGEAWRFLTGNEIATLVVDHGLAHRGERAGGFVARMARARGAAVIDHLLVGFKYIGEVLRQLDEDGRSGDVVGRPEQLVAGVEESHGVLITPAMRDKDAAGGALYLAEAASLCKDAGQTLVDRLETLWREYGYVGNVLVSTVMRGAVGQQRIRGIQDALRAAPPQEIGGRPVRAMHDRRDPGGPFGPISSGTDLASRDVLVFQLDDARVLLRPSGTEPKNKAYVEVHGQRGVADLGAEVARVDAAVRALAEDFVDAILARVDMQLPRWAHGVSGLVPVEGKLAFGAALPELVRRLEAGEDFEPWLSEELSALGPDPEGLVAEAVRRFVATAELGAATAAAVRGRFAVGG